MASSPIASRARRSNENENNHRRHPTIGLNSPKKITINTSFPVENDLSEDIFSPKYSRKNIIDLEHPSWWSAMDEDDQERLAAFFNESVSHYGSIISVEVQRDLKAKFGITDAQISDLRLICHNSAQCPLFYRESDPNRRIEITSVVANSQKRFGHLQHPKVSRMLEQNLGITSQQSIDLINWMDRPDTRDLLLDPDMEPYYHIQLLWQYQKPVYRGPNKLPPLSDPNKYTLVLDLDETLVHCGTAQIPNADTYFSLCFNGAMFQVAVKYRPHLTEFLSSMSKLFEISVFTASQKVYADEVIKRLDPEGYITHRLYRTDCTNVCQNYIKDLSTLGRDLEHLIFIDNSPQAFTFHVNNSIPILSWYDDEDDHELLKMMHILRQLREYDDVRDYCKEAFDLESLVLTANGDDYC